MGICISYSYFDFLAYDIAQKSFTLTAKQDCNLRLKLNQRFCKMRAYHEFKVEMEVIQQQMVAVKENRCINKTEKNKAPFARSLALLLAS